MTRLKLLGFWDDRFHKAILYWPFFASPDYRRYPSPMKLVNPTWHADSRAELVSYLRAGHEYKSWMGWSACRFSCGISDERIGCRDLTDGAWVWPEGLAHYVEKHDVVLPERFFDHVEKRAFTMPVSIEFPAIETKEPLYDETEWVRWTEEMVATRWIRWRH